MSTLNGFYFFVTETMGSLSQNRVPDKQIFVNSTDLSYLILYGYKLNGTVEELVEVLNHVIKLSSKETTKEMIDAKILNFAKDLYDCVGENPHPGALQDALRLYRDKQLRDEFIHNAQTGLGDHIDIVDKNSDGNPCEIDVDLDKEMGDRISIARDFLIFGGENEI